VKDPRLLTAAVVFLGLVALGVANRLGVEKDALTAVAGVLVLLAGSLKSMVTR
jgi:hypothetical protein